MTEPDLRALARRIPLVGDRALAEIVNGLATVDAMNQSRTGEGFFRRLLTGGSTDRRRGIEASTAIATVQRHLVSWVREVSDHLAYTDLTVGLLATEVEELQHDVAHAKAMSGQALAEIRELAGLLAEFINATDHRFAEIDRRLDSHEQVIDAHAKAILLLDRRVLATELWQSAWAETDLTVRSWRHEGIYSGLPWLCQVLLLARQTAAGGPGLHDFAVGDRGWRNRLADDILSDPRTASAQRQFSAHGTRTIRRLVGDVLD